MAVVKKHSGLRKKTGEMFMDLNKAFNTYRPYSSDSKGKSIDIWAIKDSGIKNL